MNKTTGPLFKRSTFINRHFLYSLLVALTATIACKKDHKPHDNNNDPGNHPVEILSFSPTHGLPGTEVIIKGKNFHTTKSQNNVYFTNSPYDAEVITASATELKVKVPLNAVTGKITVATGKYVDTSADIFTIDPEQTAIVDFAPKQGPFGTTVIITGKKFGNDIKVFIKGFEAQLVQRSSMQITINIPVNTTFTAHKLVVVSDGDTLTTADNFTVTAAGPYGRWENKNITLFSAGLSAFNSGLSFVHKNKIYWGFNRISIGETVSDYVVFDPAQPANGWVFQNHPPVDMAPANLQHAAAIVHNDRVFIGTGLAGAVRNSWFEFHPETNTSTQLTNFPVAVSGTVSFVLNNTIYAGFGGVNKDLYKFDPAANNNLGSWTQAAMAGFRELNTGNAFVLGNEVFMGRALPDFNQSRKAIYKYTASGTITRVTDMAEEAQLFSTPAFTIGNKGYLVINKNVWEYTPDANGGVWRAVISNAGGPAIIYAATLTLNGVQVVYGWTSAGALYEFKFN